jgi:cation diffusion facilitator family transporter
MAATPQRTAPAMTRERTAVLSILVAAMLVALKLGVGLGTGSLALVSAGVESSGDVIAAALTFFAVRLAVRPADRGHPYGHRRAENLGALGEASILIGGGLLVTVEAVTHLIEDRSPPSIHWYQFVVIALALVLDASRIWASFAAARRFGSPALRANALHFAGDATGSLAVLAGLLATRAGLHQADPLAALVVAAVIFAAGARLIGVNANVLMDRAPQEAREQALRAIAALDADLEVSRLRLRESAGRYFADVVVRVPPGQAVVEGHQTADEIERAVGDALPGSDVVVHVEPRRSGLDLRDRVLAIALSEPEVKEAHDITIFEGDGGVSVSLHLKFPDELALSDAHEIAERVEHEIHARPGVLDVQTHLEPLERPLLARSLDAQTDAQAELEIERLVRERTGLAPVRLRQLSTDAGRVIFLSLALPGEGVSLTEAHALAGELEDELRSRVDDVADVVVHTEP